MIDNLYKNELEHLNYKLEAAQALLTIAEDKTEEKIITKKIKEIEKQIESIKNNSGH